MFTQIRFEVVAGLYTEFFNYLIDNEYIILDIIPTKFGFTALCYAKDYKKIAYKAKKYQCKTKVIEKSGLYFKINSYLKRKGLLIGIVVFMLLAWCFNNVIWRIDIKTTNVTLKNEIGVILYDNNIYSGTTFSKEDSDNAIQEIYLSNPDVAYVSLNFYKGVLSCEIHESDKKMTYTEDTKSSDIIADKDGVITLLRVYTGFGVVQLNQSISKGDILVSATALNAKNELIYSGPRAYIEAQCSTTYSTIVDLAKNSTVYTGEILQEKRVSFLGKKITLHKLQEEEKANADLKSVITQGEFMGFRFPFTFETLNYYKKEDVNLKFTPQEAENLAKVQVDALISEDIDLKKIINKEYFTQDNGDSIEITCKVEGIYRIGK